MVTTDLSMVVPKLRYCKKAKIPSAYSKDQIPQVSRGMAVGDLFNDGKLEAVVENLKVHR
jgi:hypothetical protein